MTAGWGDVLHYPEFVKNMEKIGNYNNDLDLDPEQGKRRYGADDKRSIFTSVNELMRKLDNHRFSIDSQEVMKEDGLMKRIDAVRG